MCQLEKKNRPIQFEMKLPEIIDLECSHVDETLIETAETAIFEARLAPRISLNRNYYKSNQKKEKKIT